MRDDRLAEATLTLALAYGVFIVAERFLHVSGVAAVLAAGSDRERDWAIADRARELDRS